jgi:Domain of unknown function (DUF1854)
MGDLCEPSVTSAAGSIQLRRTSDGGVILKFAGGKSFTNIQIVYAAPLSQPKRYICFLDSSGGEICMVRDLSELAPEDRILGEEELRMRYITSTIRKILSVRCEAGTLYCQAETDRGLRELVVQNSDENVRWLSERRVLLIDVDGNRFEVPDISVLDRGMARMVIEYLQ